MAASEHQSPITIAAPPFDRADADLILRSCDVDFRVYRSVLSLASPFFEGMLTLPQPDDTRAGAEEPPVVQMAEDKMMLRLLLQWCYPGRPSEPANLMDAVALFDLAAKYNMEWLVCAVKLDVMSHVEEDPIGVYAVALRAKLRNEAATAARSCLRLPRHELYVSRPTLACISGGEYAQLLHYHYKCGTALGGLNLSDPAFTDWLASSSVLPKLKCGYGSSNSLKISGIGYVHGWFPGLVKSICSFLAYHPSILQARTLAFDKDFMSTPLSCESCRAAIATTTLVEYAEQFAQYADSVVSKVVLN